VRPWALSIAASNSFDVVLPRLPVMAMNVVLNISRRQIQAAARNGHPSLISQDPTRTCRIHISPLRSIHFHLAMSSLTIPSSYREQRLTWSRGHVTPK
jgi:hypothetical protein